MLIYFLSLTLPDAILVQSTFVFREYRGRKESLPLPEESGRVQKISVKNIIN